MMLALLAVAAATQPVEPRLFGDWIVGCDNRRFCHAVALVPEAPTEGAVTMSVRHGPEADAVPTIAFAVGARPVAGIEADGSKLPVSFVDGAYGLQVPPSGAPALLDAFRSARQLKLVGPGGASLGTVSLAGASAALLFIDEQQHRVGTVTALARPGTQPASAVPAPPPLPLVSAARLAPDSDWAARWATTTRVTALRRNHGCLAGQVGGRHDFKIVALGRWVELLLVPCGSDAANVRFVPFLIKYRRAKIWTELAPFDVNPDWWKGRPILANVLWDRETGLLTSFSKLRGSGECGLASHYAWDDHRFRLVEQAEMPECRGSADYIYTWRAQVCGDRPELVPRLRFFGSHPPPRAPERGPVRPRTTVNPC